METAINQVRVHARACKGVRVCVCLSMCVCLSVSVCVCASLSSVIKINKVLGGVLNLSEPKMVTWFGQNLDRKVGRLLQF